jgi:hypothetical protein
MPSRVPLVTDDDIKQMAREAERENSLLPPNDRRPKGWHLRRGAIRLGIVALPDLTVEELAWFLAVKIAGVTGP